MNYKSLIIIAFASIITMSCGGSGSEKGYCEHPKGLFCEWRHHEIDFTFDLSDFEFDVPLLWQWYLNDGSVCSCQLTFIGDDHQGTVIHNYCQYEYGSSSNYFDCNELNTVDTYVNKEGFLTFTDSEGKSTTLQ